MTDTLLDKLPDKLPDILLTQKFATLIMGCQMRTSSEYRKELPALYTVRVNRFFGFSLSAENHRFFNSLITGRADRFFNSLIVEDKIFCRFIFRLQNLCKFVPPTVH